MPTIYSAHLEPTQTTYVDGEPAEYTYPELVDSEIDDWADFIAIGNLTALDADAYSIHNRPSGARVFRLDSDNLFIATRED